MERFFAAAKKTLGEAGALFREAAHDAVYDFRDNAFRGFGFPSLVSTVASISVVGVAAAGTAAITLEMISKVFGPRECRTCNGWEGLRCTMCSGEGSVQYGISGLTKAKKESVESLGKGVADGSEEITYYPSGFNMGYPLPRKKCPTCNGVGVMKCTECKGAALKLKFSIDDIMDVPWKSWDVYPKTYSTQEEIYEKVTDPAIAAFLLFEKDELEGGFKYDEETKQIIMEGYHRYRRYNQVRQLVEKRQPGWEQLQDALYTINPDRAKQDPVIIQDVLRYKARKKIEAEVTSMEVPPRPAEWTEKYNLPLKKSYWSDEEQKDPVKRKEMKILLEAQEKLVGQALDVAWANEWRQKKLQEILQEKDAGETRKTMIEEQETGKAKPKMSTPGEKSVSGEPTKGRDSKAIPQSVEKSRKADPKKKKEKQERTERLAKQAAEREAALAKAKKGPK